VPVLLLHVVSMGLLFGLCGGQEWRGDQCRTGVSLTTTGSRIVVENCNLGGAALTVRLSASSPPDGLHVVVRNTTGSVLQFIANAAIGWLLLASSDTILVENSTFTSGVCFPPALSASSATLLFVGTALDSIRTCSSTSVVSVALTNRSFIGFVGCRFSEEIHLSLAAADWSSVLWHDVSFPLGFRFFALQLDSSSFSLNASRVAVPATGFNLPVKSVNASNVSIANTAFSASTPATAVFVSDGFLTQSSVLTIANNTFVVVAHGRGIHLLSPFTVSNSTLVVSGNAFPSVFDQSSDVITIAPKFVNASVELNLATSGPLYGSVTFDSGTEAGALQSVRLGPIVNLQASTLSVRTANLVPAIVSEAASAFRVHDCIIDKLSVTVLAGSLPIDVDIQQVSARSSAPWTFDIASPVRSLLLAHSGAVGLDITLQNLRSAAGVAATVTAVNVSGRLSFISCMLQDASLQIRGSRLDGLALDSCAARNSTLVIEANTFAVSDTGRINVQRSDFQDSVIVVASN
jgi:hypothetical protein